MYAGDAHLAYVTYASAICIHIDNTATVNAFQSAKPDNETLRQFVRAIWLLLAKNHVFARFIYYPGRNNFLADLFSRMFLSENKFREAKHYANQHRIKLRFPRVQPVLAATVDNNLHKIKHFNYYSFQKVQTFIKK